jgi:hypothetical protein
LNAKISRVERKEIPIYKNSHDLSNVPKPGDRVACSWEREVPPPPPPQQTCMNEF